MSISFLYIYTDDVKDTREMINSINLNPQELLKQAQNGDSNAVNQLCQGIYNATANKLGTDENYVNTIMQNADSKALANIMDAYSDATGSEIFKDIENDFSGKAEKEILLTLENAYKEVNNEEYTGDNDGRLNIDQKAQSIGKGLFNKAPDIALTIGGVALAKSAIGACISGVATTALTAVFGTAAATVATIAAPVLAGVGLVAAGVMIYKGVTQTAQAIKDGQNATTDDIAQNALQQGTEGVITTGLGIYEGYESIKAIGDIAKANNANKQYQQEINAEAQTRIEQEQLATQRTQQAQAEYNKPFEDALSNKSAQESAEAIEKKLEINENQIVDNATKITRKEYSELVKQNPKDGLHHDLYISDSNKVVNHYLRTGEIIDGDWVTYDLNKIEAIMSDADKAFSMSSLPKDSILYRYVEDLDYLPEIGEIYTEPAYVATSMSSGLSKDFGNKRMEILAPSGTACIAAGNKFAEILLNKNCFFKVLYKDSDFAILLLLNT